MNKKILLTGASGFIGQQLYDINPNQFRCVVRRTDSLDYIDSYQVSRINSNTDWADAFDGVDSIIHLAGLAHSHTFQNDDYREVNLLGTLRLAQQASLFGVKRFVFVSSIGVNGTSTLDKPFSITSKANPHNAYAKSKYDAEEGLKKLAQDSGMELAIVRPTLVYGANAPGNFGMLTKLITKLPILPFGLADNRRDFIAVQNLADLLVTCATHPDAAGHIFLASDGKAVSIKDFTNAIAEGLNKKVIQLPIPVPLMHFVSKWLGKSIMAEQLLGNLEVDSSSTKKVLGWTPPFTMEQAMQFLKEST
ncbi:NAD-dependent epimerase/dehydratase family protein [Shewanella baltica]|uniref:NAD-dependent epimerase/dehydratase family protein n=1 Tax=Shewanella baltica TaxID=62322 RepID=UPI0039AF7817